MHHIFNMEQFSIGDRIIAARSDYVKGSKHVGTITEVLGHSGFMVRYDHLAYSVYESLSWSRKLTPIEELAISQGTK